MVRPCSFVHHSPFLHSICSPLSDTNAMEHIHDWNGVKYVPVKVLQDPTRKWISAGWLSKQVKHFVLF